MFPLISIIVPIYNCEEYIEKCIISIIKQNIEDIEILLINDGSSDKSGVICEKYQKLYPNNITYIYKKNSGVSSTRNLGLKKAQGKFITFVDSDDLLNYDTLDVYRKITNQYIADLYVFSYTQISRYKRKKLKSSNYNGKFTSEKFGDLLKGYFLNSVCNKVYLREKIQYHFNEKLTMGEDLKFNLDYMNSVNTVCIREESVYNYLYHNNSSVSKIDNNKVSIQFHLLKEIDMFVINKFGYEERNHLKEILCQNMYNSLDRVIEMILYLENDKKEKIHKIENSKIEISRIINEDDTWEFYKESMSSFLYLNSNEIYLNYNRRYALKNKIRKILNKLR